MQLVALEFFVGRQVRVAVVEANHEADRDQVVLQVIHEGAAVSVVVERPARRVHDHARLVLGRVDFPQFFDADTVGLRVMAFTQVVACFQCLAQMTAHAFGEEGVLGVQFHTGLVVRAGLAITTHAHVASDDAFDCTVFVIQDVGTGKAGIDLNTHGLGLFAHPFDDIAQTDNIVTMIEKAVW